jgi:Tfp pilus assembly protein PilV
MSQPFRVGRIWAGRRLQVRNAFPTRAASSERGITLLEVLIAAVILAVGLVGVGSMVTYGAVSHAKAVNYTIAAARATEEMERIREAGYLGAQVTTGLFPTPRYTIVDSTHVGFGVSDLRNGVGVIALGEDNEAQATNPATGQPYLNMTRVTVVIAWGGSRMLRGSYRAATLVANRP